MEPPPYLGTTKHGVTISALVQPRAARNALVGTQGAALKLKVTAPPVDDRANRAVEELVAGVLSVSPTAVEVVGGRSSRHKRVAVAGITLEQAARALAGALAEGG